MGFSERFHCAFYWGTIVEKLDHSSNGAEHDWELG